jgi:hypothetical protein
MSQLVGTHLLVAAMFSNILTMGGSDRVFGSIEFREVYIARLLFRRFLKMINQKPQVHKPKLGAASHP